MSNDNRPKFKNFLAKMLVDSRTQTSFWSKPFVTASDLLFLEAMAFEQCAIIGTRCFDVAIPFFRVLAVPEGQEIEAIKFIEKMSEDLVLPFIDESLSSLDLTFRSVSSINNFDGELSDFCLAQERSKLHVDKCGESIAAWAVSGSYIGLDYPDFIRKVLHRSYSTPEELGFTAEQTQIIETGLGKNPYSVADVEREALQLFGQFCKKYYPEETKEFSFIP